jgi:hypothetical protein
MTPALVVDYITNGRPRYKEEFGYMGNRKPACCVQGSNRNYVAVGKFGSTVLLALLVGAMSAFPV